MSIVSKSLIVAFLFVSPQLVHAASLDKATLTLNWKPEPEFGGFYEALEAGTYRDAGLDVKIAPGGSGTPVAQMIASGRTDFGIVSADEVVIAQAHGADVVALFAVFQTNPQAIMTHEERGFTKMIDVFQSPGTLSIEKGLPYTDYLLKRFPPPRVKIVPYAGGIGNFLNDREMSQQCFITSEPLAAKKRGIAVKTFLIAEEGYNPYATVLATRGDLWRKNPALVRKMVEASRKGWTEYQKNPTRANTAMSHLNKALDEASFNEIAKEQKPLIEAPGTHDKLGVMTEARWKQLITQLTSLKVIERTVDAAKVFVNP